LINYMPTKKFSKAIFMDRDGTISEEVGYVNHVDRFQLLPKTIEAIRLINQSDFKAIVVTNQAGVARGYFPEDLVQKVHTKMYRLLEDGGAHLDKVYYCPHHPHVGIDKYRIDCNCRKPKPGMLEKAAEEFLINFSESYIIGDKYTEISLGYKIGATSILVLTGYGRGELELYSSKWEKKPHFVAEDLLTAINWILEQEAQRSKSG